MKNRETRNMIKQKEQNGRPVPNYINNYIQIVSMLQLKGRDYQVF